MKVSRERAFRVDNRASVKGPEAAGAGEQEGEWRAEGVQRGPLGSFGSRWDATEGWQGTTPRSEAGSGLLRDRREGYLAEALCLWSTCPPSSFFFFLFFPSLINPANIFCRPEIDGAC